MKKILSLVLFLQLSNFSFAQIPNFSFESWTSMGAYENPDFWSTLNNTTAANSVYTATKASPGSPGSFYLKLTSLTSTSGVVNGIAVSGKMDTLTKQPISGFAYSARPASFKGKWQHMIFGSSQGSVSVKLTKWNSLLNTRETIATANQTLSGMAMSWANFTINFTYTSGDIPDSCIIVLKASGANPTNNDYLWVDNLSFSGTVTGINATNIDLPEFDIYPNPTEGTAQLNLNLKKSNHLTLELIDQYGKSVWIQNLAATDGMSTKTLDFSYLKKGIYHLKVENDWGSKTAKVVLL